MTSYVDEVKAILAQREQAVAASDAELFSSTQAALIPGSGVGGYISTEELESVAMHIHADENDPDYIVALVKEKYWQDGKYSHQGYLLYHFRRQISGELKISDIGYGGVDRMQPET